MHDPAQAVAFGLEILEADIVRKLDSDGHAIVCEGTRCPTLLCLHTSNIGCFRPCHDAEQPAVHHEQTAANDQRPTFRQPCVSSHAQVAVSCHAQLAHGIMLPCSASLRYSRPESRRTEREAYLWARYPFGDSGAENTIQHELPHAPDLYSSSTSKMNRALFSHYLGRR